MQEEIGAEESAGQQIDDQAGEQVEEQVDEAEMTRRLQEEIRNLPVGDHLVFMMHSLSTLAVSRMGLAEATAAQRDLDQARLAIDAFKALMDVAQRVWSAEETAAHRGMLSQLQLAYVGVLDVAKTDEAKTAAATADADGTKDADGGAKDADATSPGVAAEAPEEASPEP